MPQFFVASHALRLVAAYSPKCGSQSVRAWCAAAIEAATHEPVEKLDRFRIGARYVDQYGDYWKVLFLRDPLRRLVGFYALWVVRDETTWCFADEEQRLSLRNKSFRQFLFAVEHLRRHDLDVQHHLVPQVLHTDKIDFDQIIAVERLSAGLTDLNRRLGVSAPIPHENRHPCNGSLRGPAADRQPAWFRAHGVPAPEFFYDDVTRAMALESYAEDVAYYRRTTGLEILGESP